MIPSLLLQALCWQQMRPRFSLRGCFQGHRQCTDFSFGCLSSWGSFHLGRLDRRCRRRCYYRHGDPREKTAGRAQAKVAASVIRASWIQPIFRIHHRCLCIDGHCAPASRHGNRWLRRSCNRVSRCGHQRSKGGEKQINKEGHSSFASSMRHSNFVLLRSLPGGKNWEQLLVRAFLCCAE